MKKRYLFTFILLVFLNSIIYITTPMAQNLIEPVNAPKYFQASEHTIDSNDFPHIAYIGDNLYYAFNDGSDWYYETIDFLPMIPYSARTFDLVSTEENLVSIAMDSEDNVHIGYYNPVSPIKSILKYAGKVDGVWETFTVDNVEDNIGRDISIAVDSSGTIYIIYVSANILMCAYTNNPFQGWTKDVVDQGNSDIFLGNHNSITVDSQDNVHLSYSCQRVKPDEPFYDLQLKYAKKTNDIWETTFVETGGVGWAGMYSSIAVDQEGSIYISYHDHKNRNLKLAIYYSFNHPLNYWVLYTIDMEGSGHGGSSIAVDQYGTIHISYAKNGNLKYASAASYPFNVESIDIVDDSEWSVGKYSSITVDQGGSIHITYLAGPNEKLKYASCCSPSGRWDIDIVDSSERVGYGSSIAIDSEDAIHISYYDDTHRSLMYATKINGVWENTTVDIGGVGLNSSIAVDQGGTIHISYYDAKNGNLKYASTSDPFDEWSVDTVDDSEGDVGRYSSIAVDQGGKIYISYYDKTNRRLKLANFDTSFNSWFQYSIDSEGDVGSYSSIAVDQEGSIYISYYDATNGDLKFAFDVDPSIFSWEHKTIDSTGEVGRYPSIAVDQRGVIYISYYDVTNGDLKFAYTSDPFYDEWFTIIVDDSEGDVGRYSSIAVDQRGIINISYYDTTNGDLKFAYNTSYFNLDDWRTESLDNIGTISYLLPYDLFYSWIFFDTGCNSIAIDSEDNIHICYLDGYQSDLKYLVREKIIPSPRLPKTQFCLPSFLRFNMCQWDCVPYNPFPWSIFSLDYYAPQSIKYNISFPILPASLSTLPSIKYTTYYPSSIQRTVTDFLTCSGISSSYKAFLPSYYNFLYNHYSSGDFFNQSIIRSNTSWLMLDQLWSNPFQQYWF